MFDHLLSSASVALAVAFSASAQTEEQPETTAGLTVAEMREHAQALAEVTTSPLARTFLAQVEALGPIEPRTIHYQADSKQWSAVPQDGYEPRDITERHYYYTKYGTPLMYALALDALARTLDEPFDLSDARICDYGCGAIGHLRMAGACGADAVGVDVDSFLEAMYSHDGDMGPVENADGQSAGAARLVTGYWPGDSATASSVGDGYTLFTSKNTLKYGYVHPREEGGKPMLEIGMTPLEYLQGVAGILEPGGYALIYNLSPAQLPPDEGYSPMADGRSPFTREQFEEAGFEILAFDESDDDRARRAFEAVGYPTRKDGAENLFALFTIAQKR